MATSLTAAQSHFTPETTPATAAATPPPITVAVVPGKGRAVIASEPLSAGQVILRDSPLLLYSAFPLAPTALASSSAAVNAAESNYCSHCFRTLRACPVPCPSCSNAAVFCNPSCHAAAVGSSHTPWLCETLARLRNLPAVISLDGDRQVQLRFLVAAYNLALVSPSSFQSLLSLHGIAAQTKDPAAANFLHSLISSASPPSPPPEIVSGFSFTPVLAASLIAKDKLNAFGLMEPFSPGGGRSARAYGIYLNASFFNHDCLPNACRFDYVDSSVDRNTDIAIRMVHEVPRGREICLSYFPVNVRYRERQKRVREDHGFECECDRCKIESNWSDSEDEGGEKEGEDAMEEDEDEGMEGADDETAAEEGYDADFPHAYFFVKFMCNRDYCGGTMAPLPPVNGVPSNVVECSACGNLKNSDDDDNDDS